MHRRLEPPAFREGVAAPRQHVHRLLFRRPYVQGACGHPRRHADIGQRRLRRRTRRRALIDNLERGQPVARAGNDLDPRLDGTFVRLQPVVERRVVVPFRPQHLAQARQIVLRAPLERGDRRRRPVGERHELRCAFQQVVQIAVLHAGNRRLVLERAGVARILRRSGVLHGRPVAFGAGRRTRRQGEGAAQQHKKLCGTKH